LFLGSWQDANGVCSRRVFTLSVSEYMLFGRMCIHVHFYASIVD
jgi:hypothetical protein